MLELKNVNSFYGNIQALYDVNLHVDRGEIITLIGANGAGKSTTLMTVCDVVQASLGGHPVPGRAHQRRELGHPPDHGAVPGA